MEGTWLGQMLRGWTPVTALQVEYSLLERTIEGEILPMARELGMEVMPWAPLKRGILSGKYARQNRGKHKPSYGEYLLPVLAEDRTYDIVDAVESVARELGTSAARVSLAWLRGRDGVASIIIGARTTAQLDENLDSAEVTLSPEHLAALEKVSRPNLDFPAHNVELMGGLANGGTRINGKEYSILPPAPQNGDERY